MLVGQQCSLENSILQSIQSGRRWIHIHGKSGCGKTHLTQKLIERLVCESDMITITFSGDYNCIEREYFPIINGLNDCVKNYDVKKGVGHGVVKAMSLVPVAGELLEYITEIMLFRKQNDIFLNQIFTDNELDLVIKIKKLAERKKVVFYFDNMHWWDRKSFDFIYLLFQNMQKYAPNLCECIFLCNTTDDQDFAFKKLLLDFFKVFKFNDFAFRDMSYDEYLKHIEVLAVNVNYTQDQLILLYNLTQSHLEVTRQALYYSPAEMFQCGIELESVTNIGYLQVLVDNRLSVMGATGEQISEALKFASLLGYAFTLTELSISLDHHKAALQMIIAEANRIHLIIDQNRHYQFTHDILRELFKRKTHKEIVNYYSKVIACYQKLYPTEYKTRIKLLLKLGDLSQIEKLYCLEIIKLKEHKDIYIPNPELEVLLTSEIKEYMAIVKNTIDLIHHEDYHEALELLRSIEPLYPIELLAEKDCLISQCLTKMLDTQSRLLAVNTLSDYEVRYDEFAEKQIWAKAMTHLVISCIHTNDQNRANRIQEKLYMFYAEHCSICDEYKTELNILRRRSTAFYDVDIARSHLRKSVEYFSTGSDSVVENPREYYMSLINYCGNLLCSGKFVDAIEYAEKAMQLSRDYNDIRFPRTYIGINNYFLSLYFSKKKDAKEIEPLFRLLMESRQDFADDYLLTSNWAVFCALSNKIEEASDVLTQMIEKVKRNDVKEPSYLYHATTNLAIINIIQHDHLAAADLLKSINHIVKNVYYHAYYEKRHSLLMKVALSGAIYNEDNIINALTDVCPHYQSNAWNFFGFTYSLNPLEHWSES